VSAALYRALYFGAQSLRGEPVARVLREMEAAQWRSPAELDALHWERRRALLEHAWRTVPFYRERWTAAGLAPGDIRTAEDWRRLPILTREDLQAHGGAMTSSRAPAGLVARTTGSSGQPAAVLRSHLSWARAHASTIRGWHWHGVDVGDRYAYLWGVALDPKVRRQARIKDLFFNRARLSAFAIDPSSAAAFHRELLHRPALWAFGYPSAVTDFAEEVAAAGLDGRRLGWRAVITTAEVLSEHQRERIGEVFGCPAVDSYGCAEVGAVGFECERGGMHVAPEAVALEAEPLEGGEREVLLTDLANYSQPVIRYRVGDLIGPAPEGPCPCGRTLPRLGRITGRAGDTLVLPDGRHLNAELTSYVFKPYAQSGAVREYQFVEFRGGRIELRVVPGATWNPAALARVRGDVREMLGFEPEVRTVERIRRPGRAKHRDFVRADDLDEGA
jgi:phenylacetate-CoA ligase